MEAPALQLLIVDSAPERRQELRDLLDRSTLACAFAEADSLESARSACASSPPDCLLLADLLPDAALPAALDVLRSACDAPIVLIADQRREDQALAALDQGADDYLVRGMLTPGRLALSIRRAVEAATVRSDEEWLRLALRAGRLSAWMWDVSAGTLTFSPRLRRFFGMERGQVSYSLEQLRALVYPPDLADYEAAVAAALAGERPYQLTVRSYSAAGQLRWIEVSGVVERDQSGRPLRVFGVTRDISAERQAQAEREAAQRVAEEAHARLIALLNSAPNGIAFLDRELRYQLINAALADLNGRPVADHIGRTLGEVLPALAELVEPIIRRVLESGEAAPDLELHSVPLPRDGIERDWLLRYFPVRGSGEVIGVGATVVDITSFRRTAAALEAANTQAKDSSREAGDQAARLNSLIAHAPVGISLLDTKLRFQHINAHLAALNGLPIEAHLGRPVGEVLPDLAPQLVPIYERLLATGEPLLDVEIVGETLAAPGARRVWSASYFPVHRADGLLIGAGVVVVEITDRKRDAAELVMRAEELSRANAELARALRLKDEFLAMMSHELRTPLTVILGVAESLSEGYYGPVEAQQRKALDSVTASGRHLLAILSDILDLARIEAGNEDLDLELLDVSMLCRMAMQYVEAAAQRKGIRLLRSVEQGVDGIRADERRLTQILVNLLDNAVKFTPEGGAVGLEVTVNREHECIQLAVWDTGIGIDPADYGRLFQPFTQIDARLSRQHGGVGLGLTLVRRLVELHGGSVSLESAPGRGSRFVVCMPWSAEDNLVAEAPRASPTWPWARPPRLLIVEDHEPTLALYRDMLGRAGCAVTAARSGEEALAKLPHLGPDVLLLDVQLPEMDGLAVIRQIRADPRLSATPIIVLTALAMPGDRERCLEAGASAYLVKPIGLRALLATIAELLG